MSLINKFLVFGLAFLATQVSSAVDKGCDDDLRVVDILELQGPRDSEVEKEIIALEEVFAAKLKVVEFIISNSDVVRRLIGNNDKAAVNIFSHNMRLLTIPLDMAEVFQLAGIRPVSAPPMASSEVVNVTGRPLVNISKIHLNQLAHEIITGEVAGETVSEPRNDLLQGLLDAGAPMEKVQFLGSSEFTGYNLLESAESVGNDKATQILLANGAKIRPNTSDKIEKNLIFHKYNKENI